MNESHVITDCPICGAIDSVTTIVEPYTARGLTLDAVEKSTCTKCQDKFFTVTQSKVLNTKFRALIDSLPKKE